MKQGMKIYNYLFLLIALLCVNIAQAQVQDENEMIKEERAMEKFTSIEVGGNFMVKLVQQQEYAVKIEAQSTHISNIRTSIFNEVLTIDYAGLRKPSHLYVTIYAPDLASIRLTGAAELMNDLVFEDSILKLNAEGASKI